MADTFKFTTKSPTSRADEVDTGFNDWWGLHTDRGATHRSEETGELTNLSVIVVPSDFDLDSLG